MTRSHTVPAFDEIETHGVGVNIKVEAGPQSDLVLSGDDNLVPRITTKVEGHRLIVDLTDPDIDPDLPLLVTFHVPSMTKITAENEAHVDITMDSPTTLFVDLNSSARVTAHGKIARLDAELTGSARLEASQLAATDVRLEATGNANASVCVTGKLDVDLDGGADAVYSCNPRDIDRDIDESSNFDKR